uniref:Uncharacterized protein n=1 Tax=Chenopodium quinoa TaxID=63459 RepID=A0A803MDY3_CHEQI
MAKCQAVFLLVGALCVLSLAGVANAAENHFKVQGMVYCDTCRATVKLECRNITAGTQTFKAEAVTDKVGQYSIPVNGDFEDDICEIELVKSPNSECSEVSHDVYAKQSAKVSLTSNNGEASDIRSANALGFMRKEPLKECPEVLKELDLYDVKAN